MSKFKRGSMFILFLLSAILLASCNNGNNLEIDIPGDIHEHTLTKVNKVDATCTSTGMKEYYSCSGCDQIFNDAQGQNVIANAALLIMPVKDHDLINHEAKVPTCTKVGWDAYVTCKDCEYSTYNEIPANGHTIVVDEAVAPTCTNTGLTEGKHCSVCNEVTTY